MRWRLVIALLLVGSIAVPAAAADHVEEIHERDGRYFVVDVHGDADDGERLVQDAVCELFSPFCIDPYYQSQATVEVWEESNGCEGLQRTPFDCDEDGSFEPKDTPVAVLGCPSGHQSPCGLPNVF